MPVLAPVTLAGKHASRPRDTYAFTWVPASEADATTYVDEALKLHAAGKALPFATIDAATDCVVGSTRYLNVEF